MKTNRVWRDLAIEWFDAMNREVGFKFDREFLADVHRLLNFGTEDELDSIRKYCARICRHIEEVVNAPKDERTIGGDWEFHLRCDTFFLALYELALEDFR